MNEKKKLLTIKRIMWLFGNRRNKSQGASAGA